MYTECSVGKDYTLWNYFLFFPFCHWKGGGRMIELNRKLVLLSAYFHSCSLILHWTTRLEQTKMHALCD